MKHYLYFEIYDYLIQINIISALITIASAILFASAREIIYREFEINKKYPDNRVLSLLPSATNIIMAVMVLVISITITPQ